MKIYIHDGEVYDDKGIEEVIADDFESLLTEYSTFKEFFESLPDSLYESIKERFMNDPNLYGLMGIVAKEVNTGRHLETSEYVTFDVCTGIFRMEPLEVAKNFKDYFEGTGRRRYDGRRNNNNDTYQIVKSTKDGIVEKVVCVYRNEQSLPILYLSFEKCDQAERLAIGKNEQDICLRYDHANDKLEYCDTTALKGIVHTYDRFFGWLGVRL